MEIRSAHTAALPRLNARHEVWQPTVGRLHLCASRMEATTVVLDNIVG